MTAVFVAQGAPIVQVANAAFIDVLIDHKLLAVKQVR